MHSVMDWMRAKQMVIPGVWTHRPERLAVSRMAISREGRGNLPVDLAGADQRAARKTVIMILMDRGTVNSNAEALERAGYEVHTVSALCDALEAARQSHPSLIIVSGGIRMTRICLALRSATTIPILALLTAASEADMLATLDAGADDCQPASISAQEVLMRTRVLLRRSAR
jgi:CheY-like chemotaxis protein